MNSHYLRLLFVVVLASAPARALLAAPPVPESIREIYVPLDEFTRIFEEQPGCVLLSREEYDALLAAATPDDAGAPVPCATAVVAADYAIAVGRDRADVSASLTLDVLEPGLRAIDLLIAHVGVRRALLDGVPAPLAQSAVDRLTLFVEGPGRHVLTLELTAPVETSAALQTLTFRLPEAPSSRTSLTVPGNVEIKSGAAVVSRVFDEAAQLTRFEIVPRPAPARAAPNQARRQGGAEPPPPLDVVTLVMTLNNRLLQTQRAVTARGVIVDEITASYERIHATFLMTVLHQAVDRFRFAIPAGFDVTDVQSPLLSQWAIQSEPSGSVLDVRLRESTTESVVIGLSALRTGGDPAEWSLPRLAPLDVVAEAAVVGLLVEDRLAMKSLSAAAMIPIDTGVITDALSGMMFSGEPGAPRLRAVAAFYAPRGSAGFEATGVFRRPASALHVTANLLLSLTDDGLRMHGGFTLEPASDPLFAAEILAPRGWHTLSFTDADGAPLPFEQFDAAGADDASPARVRVSFAGGIAPGTSRSIYFEAVHTPDGWLTRWPSRLVTFPAFSVGGADREVGAIAVDAGDEMVAYPESVDGLTPLDDADKAEYGLAAASGLRQAPAFRYERGEKPFRATFRVERVSPRATARTYSFLGIEPHLLSAHYELVYEVDRAKTDTLSLSLPLDTPPDLTVTGVDGTQVKEYESTADAERRRWTVHLARARRGAIRVAVDFEQPLDAATQTDLVLPIVRAEDVAYQSGVVAVEGSAELELETKTTLRRVDVGELAGASHTPGRATAGGLGVFAFVGDEPAVAVRVARRSPYALPTAIVQRAEMITQIAEDGAAQTAVRLLLRTSAAFLEAELPPASELWSAQIDGRPLQPQREGNRLLLSLPAEDRLLDVRMVYQARVAPVGLWGEVALSPPRLFVRAAGDEGARAGVPSADLHWNVYLPPGFRLADYEGTATTTQLAAPELAAWSVAKFLWACTGGIRPFYRGVLPTLSRARELSSRGTASRVMDAPLSASPQNGLESLGYLEADAEEAEGATIRRRAPQTQRGPGARKKEALMESEEPAAEGFKAMPPPPPPPQAVGGGRAGVAPQPGIPAVPSAGNLWALEGVRSLKIDLEPIGSVVAFSSLGVDPRLRLTLAHQRRMNALGWGLAFSAALIGLMLTPRPVRTRARYIALVAIVATVVPILFDGAELTRLCNPVFYAVVLLVPFYAGLRLCRWIGANAMRPLRLRPATAAMLALLLGVGLPSAHAQPTDSRGTRDAPVVIEIEQPQPPIQLPGDAILVPYDPTAAFGPDGPSGAGNQVLLPYALFQALWSAAHPPESTQTDPAPAAYAFSGGGYTATLGESDSLDVTGYLDLVVYVDGVVAVPLALSGAALSRVTLDGKPAQLGAPAVGGGGEPRTLEHAPFTLTVTGRGTHRLELALALRVTRQGGWREALGRIPSAPGTSLTLQLPQAGTELRLDGFQDRRAHESITPGETLATALGPNGRVSLRWRPRISEGLRDSSLTASSEAVLDVREDGLRLVWRLALDSGRGEYDAFRLVAPPEYLVHSVTGPNVRGWSRAESDDREITVTLLQPGKGTQNITLVLHRSADLTIAESSDVHVPAVRVAGAALQNGRLTIRRSALLEVATADVSGAGRVDTPAQAERLIAQTPDAMESPLGMTVYQSYQFASLPFDIRLSAHQARADASALLQSILRIGERRRTLETRITINPARQPVYELAIGIPADLNVDAVDAPGAFEWAVSEGDARTLTVRLTSGQTSSFPIVLRGTLGQEAALTEMMLPVITVLGSGSRRGEFAIQTDPAFDLTVDAIRGCREMPIDRIHPWLTPPQRPLTRVALSHSGADYEARLRIAPRVPVVACTTITNVRVTESTIEETLLLDFDITQTGIREISFLLPETMKDARISVPMLRQKTVEPLPGETDSRVRVRLTLQDEIMGDVRVLVEHDRALTTAAFPVPMAVVETGRTHRQYVAFESAGRDEVEVESQQDVEALVYGQGEWQSLTSLVGSALTQAYVATGEQPAITLKTRERAVVETTGARIGLARTVFVVDAAGAYRASQSYRVDNRTEAYLEVILPAGADLWSAEVAGEQVRPAAAAAASDRRVRIPLIKSAAGDLDYEVLVRYAGQLPPPGGLRTVEFPLLRSANVAVELSQVSLFLPDENRWFDFDGTLRRVDDEAELAAGLVRYQTRQTERLQQTLESESAFARVRASASLEQIQSQTEELRRSAAAYGYNAALQSELQMNEAAVGRVQVQQQALQRALDESAQSAESLDNRGKLDMLYEKQSVSRARNQVQQLSDNFLPPQEPEDRKQADGAFNKEWLTKNALTSERRQEFDDSVDRIDAPQLRQQAAAKESPQFGQLSADRDKDGRWEGKQPMRSSRAAGNDEIALQYRDKLGQAARQQDDYDDAAVPDSDPLDAVRGRAAAGEAFALSSLAVELPVRGRAYHFTTPRGDVSITARSVSRGFLGTLKRIGVTLAVVAAFLGLRAAVLRGRLVERFSRSHATVLIMLGAVSILTGMLPVLGIGVLIAGVVLRCRPTPGATPVAG